MSVGAAATGAAAEAPAGVGLGVRGPEVAAPAVVEVPLVVEGVPVLLPGLARVSGALFSGSRMEMRDRRRSSFLVRRELRGMTG